MFKATQLFTLTGSESLFFHVTTHKTLDDTARNDSHPLVCDALEHNTGNFNEEEWPQFSEM